MLTFSIITVTRNASLYINRTLKSVLMQTYDNIEHIIIDGASSDDTVTLAQDYAKKCAELQNSRTVVIVSEPDKGLYDAMNKGIRLSKGDYIVFLNAGDCLPFDHTLQHLSSFIESEKLCNGNLPAVVYGDTEIIDERGNLLGFRRLRPPKHLTWRSFRFGMLVCHQAFYVKGDIARTTFYDQKYKYSADIDWCIRVMKIANNLHLTLFNTKETLVYYTQQGLTTRYHKASLIERFRIMTHHYGVFSTIFMHLYFVIRSVKYYS